MKLDLLKIRRSLHSLAELSGKEQMTSQYIFNLILKFKPDYVMTNIAGFGLVFGFNGKYSGGKIGFRAELDAVPIEEENNFFYKSKTSNVSHKCGHDGHSTILIGLAERLSNREFRGQVYLIFQPSEENGEGAEKMLSDYKFREIDFDYIFAIHNVPNFEQSLVLIRDGIFAASSIGVKVKFIGEQSHTAEMSYGVSPSVATSELIWFVEKDLANKYRNTNIFANIVYTCLGVKGFGVLPAFSEIWLTARAIKIIDRDYLVEEIKSKVSELAEKYKLQFKIELCDNFPSTINDSETNNIVKKSVEKLNLKFLELEEPFMWSEDFGRFTEKYKGAIIGLGAGQKCMPLHNSRYDFPDEITKTGINLLEQIIYTVNE